MQNRAKHHIVIYTMYFIMKLLSKNFEQYAPHM